MSMTATEVKSRPIIFSGPLVRQILAGKKNQTRRVVSCANSTVNGWTSRSFWSGLRFQFSKPLNKNHLLQVLGDNTHHDLHLLTPDSDMPDPDDCGWHRVRPVWEVGDQFWVKENFILTGNGPSFDGGDGSVKYKWTSGRFMPRTYSRLSLEITELRVQRIHDISAKDIIAEGLVDRPHHVDGLGKCPISILDGGCYTDLKSLWAASWQKINGKRKGCTWADNCWCWCITFKRVEGNQ